MIGGLNRWLPSVALLIPEDVYDLAPTRVWLEEDEDKGGGFRPSDEDSDSLWRVKKCFFTSGRMALWFVDEVVYDVEIWR